MPKRTAVSRRRSGRASASKGASVTSPLANCGEVRQKGAALEPSGDSDAAVRQIAAPLPEAVYGPLGEVHGWAQLLHAHCTEDAEVRCLAEQLYAATERLIAALDPLPAAMPPATKHYDYELNVVAADRAAQPPEPPSKATDGP